MKEANLENKLRLAIKDALMAVTKGNSPAVYQFFHRKDGSVDVSAYNRLENMIVQRIIGTRISIEAIIPQIENELDLM